MESDTVSVKEMYVKSGKSVCGTYSLRSVLLLSSRKHLRTKVTPGFNLTYSLESPHRRDSHPKHMILRRTYDNKGKNTGLL